MLPAYQSRAIMGLRPQATSTTHSASRAHLDSLGGVYGSPPDWCDLPHATQRVEKLDAVLRRLILVDASLAVFQVDLSLLDARVDDDIAEEFTQPEDASRWLP